MERIPIFFQVVVLFIARRFHKHTGKLCECATFKFSQEIFKILNYDLTSDEWCATNSMLLLLNSIFDDFIHVGDYLARFISNETTVDTFPITAPKTADFSASLNMSMVFDSPTVQFNCHTSDNGEDGFYLRVKDVSQQVCVHPTNSDNAYALKCLVQPDNPHVAPSTLRSMHKKMQYTTHLPLDQVEKIFSGHQQRRKINSISQNDEVKVSRSQISMEEHRPCATSSYLVEGECKTKVQRVSETRKTAPNRRGKGSRAKQFAKLSEKVQLTEQLQKCDITYSDVLHIVEKIHTRVLDKVELPVRHTARQSHSTNNGTCTNSGSHSEKSKSTRRCRRLRRKTYMDRLLHLERSMSTILTHIRGDRVILPPVA